MTVFHLVISGALLGIIAWQDFRDRSVSAWLLALLALSELVAGGFFSGTGTLLRQSAQNAFIIFSLLTFVWIYVIAKNRKWMNLFKDGFGSADLLLLLILGINFPPFIYVIFMLSGFILALLSTLLIRMFRRPLVNTVPLAGYLSLWAILVMTMNVAFPRYSLVDYSWWMTMQPNLL